MSDGKAKVTLLLELKNRLRGGLTQAKKFLNENVQDMKNKLGSLKEKHIQAFQSMRDEIPLFGRAMDVLGNPYVKMIVGLTALAAVYVSASRAASDWQNKMSKINATALLSQPELKDLSAEIRNISKEFGGKAMDSAAAAFEKMISGGLKNKTALDTLRPILQAAKAFQTDAGDIADSVTAVMNSTGEMNGGKILDVLSMTQNLGRVEFKDIATYLPKIIPMAQQAGFNLNEVSGSYAFLTRQMSAEQSATGLQNAFKALSDQQIIFGTSSKAGLKGLGINVFDATGKVKPLVDILGLLRDKMKGLTDSQKVTFLDQIGFDMESATAISKMVMNVDGLKNIIDQTTNSTGQLQKTAVATATSMDSWNGIGGELKNTMINIGNAVNDTFGRLGQLLLPIVKEALPEFQKLLLAIWEVAKPIIELFAGILGGVLDIITGVIKWLDKMGLLKIAAIALMAVISPMLAAMMAIVEAFKWIRDRWKSPTQILIDKREEYRKRHMDPMNEDIQQANAKIVDQVKPEDLMPAGGTGKPSGFDPSKFKKTNTDGSGTSVSGKAEQVRNITITIGNVFDIDKMNVTGDNGKVMSKDEFEKWAKEMWFRMIRNFETSYS